ncbi:hypothetical protein SUGI_0223520 [Cryptomeria japonica]|nr:hypothetical protein SUGI_0223520 [Cryptomeria japonica]
MDWSVPNLARQELSSLSLVTGLIRHCRSSQQILLKFAEISLSIRSWLSRSQPIIDSCNLRQLVAFLPAPFLASVSFLLDFIHSCLKIFSYDRTINYFTPPVKHGFQKGHANKATCKQVHKLHPHILIVRSPHLAPLQSNYMAVYNTQPNQVLPAAHLTIASSHSQHKNDKMFHYSLLPTVTFDSVQYTAKSNKMIHCSLLPTVAFDSPVYDILFELIAKSNKYIPYTSNFPGSLFQSALIVVHGNITERLQSIRTTHSFTVLTC